MLFCDRPEAFKKRFPGEILAVHAAEPARVRDVLAKPPECAARCWWATASIFSWITPLAGLRNCARASRLPGVLYDSIQSVAPTIEDLFVSALGEGRS